MKTKFKTDSTGEDMIAREEFLESNCKYFTYYTNRFSYYIDGHKVVFF